MSTSQPTPITINQGTLPTAISSVYQVVNNTFIAQPSTDPKDTIQVEIGDRTQPNFVPQFKLSRWNEVSFSITAISDMTAALFYSGNKIIYKGNAIEVHFYDQPTASVEGGFEFEWVLLSAPVSNVLTATIQTQGLDFFYQPLATAKDIVDGVVQPMNVAGSYAVYHSTKGGVNDAAGMNYKVGKVCHIYLPQATDANNNQTWCNLNIDTKGGTLTVTVPQDFLDSAVYPVTIDPTIGYTSIGASSNTNAGAALPVADVKASLLYTASTGDTITAYNLYSNLSVAGSDTWGCSAYTFSGGKPVTRTGSEVTITVNSTTAQWLSNTTSVSLTAGTVYCAAVGDNTFSVSSKLYFDSTGAGSESLGTSNGALPATWSQLTTSTNSFSVYATVTSGGGSTTISPLSILGAG